MSKTMSKKPDIDISSDTAKILRRRNYAVLGVIMFLFVIFYLMTIVKIINSGGL